MKAGRVRALAVEEQLAETQVTHPPVRLLGEQCPVVGRTAFTPGAL